MSELCSDYASLLIYTVHLTVWSYNVKYGFQSESIIYICLNVKELLAQNMHYISGLSNCNESLAHIHLVCNPTLKHLAKLTKWLIWVARPYLYRPFDSMSFSCHAHVSEWIHTLYLPEYQELLAWNRRDIWRHSDWKGNGTQNHLVCKRTLNRLVKLTKWLSWVASTYLRGAFEYMFL